MPTASPAIDARQARFQLLVMPHLERLLAFAERRLGNRADAEDVVQESFIRAWVAFPSLRDESRLRAWLFQILRSSLSDFTRKEDRRDQLLPLGDSSRQVDSTALVDATGPFEHAAASLSRERVETMLRSIPDEFAAAVELHDLEGFRYREIAEILGVATGTVMSRIFRGRKLLAELMMRERRFDSGERRFRIAGRPLQQRQA